MNKNEITAGLQLGLRSVTDVIKADDRAEVLFYIENKGEQPIPVLSWQLPLDGKLSNDLLDITIGDVALQYQGSEIKRSAPVESDYTTIAVGECREVVVNLSEYYELTVTGSYYVRLRTSGDKNTFLIDGVEAAIEVPIVGDNVTIVRE